MTGPALKAVFLAQVLLIFALAGLAAFAVAQPPVERAQPPRPPQGVLLPERAEQRAQPPRTWQLTTLPRSVRVDVVDTTGACLYVARTSDDGVAVTAVPKTQLPPGAGCQ